jgi:hypothetical protein
MRHAHRVRHEVRAYCCAHTCVCLPRLGGAPPYTLPARRGRDGPTEGRIRMRNCCVRWLFGLAPIVPVRVLGGTEGDRRARDAAEVLLTCSSSALLGAPPPPLLVPVQSVSGVLSDEPTLAIPTRRT